MNGKGFFYWDSCIFIAHLQNENRIDTLDMLGVKEQVAQFDMNQINLVTSTITITEVLHTTLQPEDYEKFLLIFSRRNCHLIDVTKKIAHISEEIRSYYYIPKKATVSTPDCIHLATAISFNCDAFYTFDGEGNHQGLLSLSSPIAGKYNIPIQKPVPTRPAQLTFDINVNQKTD